MEERVIRNQGCKSTVVTKGSEEDKIERLKQRIRTERETLFFVSLDEAHFAPVKDNIVDKFINDREVASASNVILLQISATPYSLVTQNTRIKKDNIVDMVKEMSQGGESSVHSYWGIGKFIESTEKLMLKTNSQQDPLRLTPGTMSKDNFFERTLEQGSNLVEYIEDKFDHSKLEEERKKGQTGYKTKIEHLTRLYGLILQYCSAMLRKKGREPSTMNSKLARVMNPSELTKRMLDQIDSGEDGKGSMILIRVLGKEDGKILGSILKRLRDALHFENKFAIVLDIDDRNFASELCEEAFLPRLQWWNAAGNKEYRPSSYKDLLHLPVILVVVEKGS